MTTTATSAVLALGLALAPGVLRGARADDVPVTLAEALALAEHANPELQAAAARVDAQAARTEAVRRSRRPRLGMSMDWFRTDQPAGVFASKLNAGQFTMADFDVTRIDDPAALSHLGTSLSLEMPIDVFGKVGNRAAAMAAYGDAASAGTREAVPEIHLRVTEAYRQAEMAGRAVEVTARVLDVAKAREAEVEARVGTGSALEEAVVEAGVVRFRPMLLTAAAVVVGSSVMVFDPIFQGLAISLMTGEVAATFLSRLAVPVVYYLIARRGRAEELSLEGHAPALAA